SLLDRLQRRPGLLRGEPQRRELLDRHARPQRHLVELVADGREVFDRLAERRENRRAESRQCRTADGEVLPDRLQVLADAAKPTLKRIVIETKFNLSLPGSDRSG